MSDERELKWLRRVRDLSQALSVESDPVALISRILDAAIDLTNAERGLLVLVPGRREDGKLRLELAASRGFDEANLAGEIAISQRVVERVLESQSTDGLVMTSGDDKDLLAATSVLSHGIRSIAGMPLVLRGEVRGVLYLDHRSERDFLDEDDLPTLRTFACQAALALETAKLRQGTEPSLTPERAGTLHLLQQFEGAAKSEEAPTAFGGLVGRSPAMIAVYEEIEKASRSEDPVLLLGEAGTGKSKVAREIHAQSAGKTEPFVAVDCEAFEGDALVSELFGHEEGAFPWAKSNRRGAFVLAGKGTLFLRHVESVSAGIQSRLISVLRDHEVRAQGAARSRRIACRVVASASDELPSLVAPGSFRADLYFRLDVLRLVLPPLRQRPGDVLLLMAAVLQELGRRGLRPSAAARQRLEDYAWPGNGHELRAEVLRLSALNKPEISLRDLAQPIQAGAGLGAGGGAYAGKTLGDVEREMVELALAAAKGNKSMVARQLGIPRSSLYHLIERYGLDSS